VRADGECSFLKPSGLAFGLSGAGTFDSRLALETISLEAGDLLALYSDGISEAMDREEAEFGEYRLAEVLKQPAEASALCTRVIEAVRTFANGAPQHDDMTLVIVRRTD
jgi:sigma-B regulation protein RsbU (phosphoserine phosphatase)